MIRSEWLTSFVAFAEELNFTRAAELLHISQPALHVQVRKLAESLSVPLYRRQGRRLELTSEGKELLAFGREIEDRTARFVDTLRGRRETRPTVLSAGEGTYLYLLGPAIRRFAEKHPLRVLTRDRDGTLDAVRSGEAHLGVAVLSGPEDGIESEKLCQVGARVVVPRSHPLASRKEVRASDLSDEPLVVPPPGRPHREALARLFEEAGAVFRPAVEANGWEVILSFAKLRLGLAIVNEFCPVPSGFVARPLRRFPPVTYFLVRRAGRSLSSAAKELALRIREAVSAS